MIGQRKDSLPPLHLGLRAVLLEEGNRILIGEAIEGTVEKLAVAADVIEKVFHLTGIGEITAAFSCNVQFFSTFFIFFKTKHHFLIIFKIILSKSGVFIHF